MKFSIVDKVDGNLEIAVSQSHSEIKYSLLKSFVISGLWYDGNVWNCFEGKSKSRKTA